MRFDVAGRPCVMKFAWDSITTQPFCSKPCLFSMKNLRTIFAKLTAVNCEVAICQDYCDLAHSFNPERHGPNELYRRFLDFVLARLLSTRDDSENSYSQVSDFESDLL